MNDVGWSDKELRSYILSETHYEYEFDKTMITVARERFRVEALARLVPAVQANVLGQVGALTDPEGLALVARELMIGICCDQQKRRWLMVSTQPWSYLESWLTREVVRAYRSTVGRDRSSGKPLKEIERANH
jgi:hypothetical protein